MRLTYHLAPRDSWQAAAPEAPLVAPSLAADGFIHCTNGPANMVETANRHFRDDPRAFVILSIDLDLVTSPWRFEDAGRLYPHVFGPIDRAAILGAIDAPRDRNGVFLRFDA